MEKNRPHCRLAVVKALLQAGRIRVTYAALSGAKSLGMDWRSLVSTVAGLKPDDFYKSMTTYNDHRIWQDVYRPMAAAGEIYLKLTVIEEVLVISFKKAKP